MIDFMRELRKIKGKISSHDMLDAVRTRLANERTVLSYTRTSLALIVAGVTFIRFFDNRIIEIVGWAFLPFGLINLIYGIYRFRSTRKHVNETLNI